ncbi:winged helix-turn-helix domain-containing protein [Enterobacter wuhouensis]|uniref:winged helix-turn-helix domain-containing protein n=1 Tax=Enterobacter wuhouensis TaxID=2529381 RepID=UPI003D775FF3
MKDCNANVVYLLNSVVEFRPKPGTLTSRLNDIVVTLHTPSSYCLLKLINERFHLVSQKELMNAGWPETGDQVSPNTFYQMVFNLRQGLEKAGGQGIVVTVPRQGLKIKNDVVIETVDTHMEELPEKEFTPECVIPEVSRAASFNKVRNITLIALSSILLISSGMLYKSAPESDLFANYGVMEYRMCKVNFNGVVNDHDLESLLSKSHIDCSLRQSIILTQNENHSRFSVISCAEGKAAMKKCSLSLYVQ